MKICLSKTILGTPKHLVWSDDEGYRWVSKVPADAWSFGHPGHSLDLTELAHAQGSEHTWQPPKEHHRSITELLGEENDLTNIRWDLILPPALYKKQLQDLLQRSQDVLKNSNEWKYQEIFERTQKAISGLSHISVNKRELGVHLQTCEPGRKDELLSFQQVLPICYSRCTSTGRLTVASGPKILTLDKKFRNILESRHGKNGSIIQLDYVSLEPRTLLALTKQDAPDDVYDILQRNIKDTSRNDLKKATMLVLYGGGISRLRKILGPSANPEFVMDVIRDAFRLKFLEDTLSKEFAVSSMLTNYYGRVMHPKRNQPGYLVAMYTQSSAVDVVLQGFSQIREKVDEIDGIDAVGIVHDALWLDVHNDCEKNIDSLRESGMSVPGFNIRFLIDRQKISS